MRRLALKIAHLLAKVHSGAEGTSWPLWFIAKKAPFGHEKIFLAGVWFSREHAEAYLGSRHRDFPKGAFVYCASGQPSVDWKNLIIAVDDILDLDNTPDWGLEGYQRLLAKFADAIGATGSPSLDEVLEIAEMLRDRVRKADELKAKRQGVE